MRGSIKITSLKRQTLHRILLFAAVLVVTGECRAVTRTSVSSGNFNSASTWAPSGIPGAADNLVIVAGHTLTVSAGTYIHNLTVQSGATIKWTPNVQLTVYGNLDINGTLDVTGGDIQVPAAGSTFSLGTGATFIWDPADNTAAGATLFTNTTEQFNQASTVIIRKWFNYQSVPLADVIQSDFGNLTLTTLSNGLLFEWNQENGFEQHPVHGKLTVDQGWIVLDNTGSISNTTFGSIELKNINAYLDFHSGDHPGSFTVNTGSITNIGGTMNGITNGDGNITLYIAGDFINVGYSVLIYNSGAINKGNGNATLDVQGIFRQPGGDFRGIFNLSSSNAGITTLRFQDAEITGGQFMGHYACHTGGGSSLLHFRGNLRLHLTTVMSRFRGNGLTSLSGTNSNNELDFRVDGKLTLSGHPAAEATTSSSTGSELLTVKGPVISTGTKFNCNYGNHTTVIEFNAPVIINGGSINLSRTSGTLTALFNDSLIIRSGELICKGENGSSTIVINGNYWQTGGNTWLYSHPTAPATAIIYTIINGSYIQSGGNLNFDSNNASTASHHLSLSGASFTVSDSAHIISGNSNSSFGILHFDYPGKMDYNAIGTDWEIQQVKQHIASGCTLNIANGAMQVASTATSEPDMLRIGAGGILDLNQKQVYSNGKLNNCGITADAGGIIRVSRLMGLYNGTTNAALSSAGNLKYYLNRESIVEYYGTGPISITGSGSGTANGIESKYGILNINLNDPTSKAILSSNTVAVRKSLVLTNGILDLSNLELDIENGHPSGIQSLQGSILSEGAGAIYIDKPEAGEHTWNFCTALNKQLPFSFTNSYDATSYLRVSTRPTNTNNFPYPPVPSGDPVTNLNIGGNHAASRMIDRWYSIESPGTVATVSMSYTAVENTLPTALADSNIAMSTWSVGSWLTPQGTHSVASGTGTVRATGISHWGVFSMVSWPKSMQADLLSFTAIKENSFVELEWKSTAGSDARFYAVERSSNGSNFETLQTLQAIAGNQSQTYNSTDKYLLQGTSWYRIRQTDFSGLTKYSASVKIENGNSGAGIQVISVTPNPFNNYFSVVCNVPDEGSLTMQLLNINGQEMDARQFTATSGRNTIEWQETRNIPTGIYLMIISDGKRKTVTKIYKQ